MSLGLVVIVLAVLLAATLVAGAWLHWRQRPRGARPGESIQPQRLGADALGQRATLLQFSSRECSRSAGIHYVLATIAEGHDGVAHLDVDLTDRPDIAEHFHVLQTPTTLVLDGDGIEQARFGGICGRDVVELALGRVAATLSH